MVITLDKPVVDTIVVKGGIRGSVLTPGRRGVSPGQPSSGGPGGGSGGNPGKGGGGRGGKGGGSQLRSSLTTIQIPASTGQQSYVVGFTPKLVILFGYGSAVDSNLADGFEAPFGAASGASNQYCACGTVQDNVQSNSANRLASVIYEVQHPTHTTASVAKASLVSLNANGFTLNWTIVPGATRFCFAVALGGNKIQASVVQWTYPASSGNQSITGAGFQPECVIHVGTVATLIDTGTRAGTFTLGVMTASNQWGVGYNQSDGDFIPDSSRYFQADRCLHIPQSNTGVDCYARYVSLDADGFTIARDDPAVASRQFFSICLKGISFHVGSIAKTTGAAPATLNITGVPFKPELILLTCHGGAAQSTDTAITWAALTLALASADSVRCISLTGMDSGSSESVQAARRLSATDIYVTVTNTTGVPDVRGIMSQFSNDGADIVFNPNSAVAAGIGYIAFK